MKKVRRENAGGPTYLFLCIWAEFQINFITALSTETQEYAHVDKLVKAFAANN